MRSFAVSAVALAACYAPNPQPGAPCTNGVCPDGLVCAQATQTCEREGSVDGGRLFRDAGNGSDGPMVSTDARGDAMGCFGGGLVSICPTAPITTALSITSNTTIDTDTSPLCIAYTGDSEGALCVIAATTVSIAQNRRLRATGTKPLVVLATGTFTLDGTIDVAAGAGANPSTCVAPTAATGAQGGAGGSWHGKGGSGAAGVSGLGPSAAPGTMTIAFHGGCAGGKGAGGGGGTGGSGGGAVYLIAATSISVTGTLNASGAAGSGGSSASGGGGGGAGGFIGLDAPSVTVNGTGRVFANGGGGGEGSTPNHGGNSGLSPGSPTTAASGGSGGANHGGNGGAGSAGSTLAGDDGNAGGNCGRNGQSGGGGGGGAGFVYVFPTQTLGGSVAPPPG